MQAFIRTLLAFDPAQKDAEGGILGVVKSYFGCVEAQGRGSLHCHMVVWVEGGLNPNEMRERIRGDTTAEFQRRLLAFLDDTISTSMPPLPEGYTEPSSPLPHPCSVRGLTPEERNSDVAEQLAAVDLHHVVAACQKHVHSNTCYKYWKGKGHAKECRFDLDEGNVCLESTIDPETGQICLRCMDGMINNFNDTVIQAMRCNMDIKFIGNGQDAKAVLMYITDYITKSPLKAHVSYAALEVALTRLSRFDGTLTDVAQRARRTLQRAAFALVAQQELSAQQVASYLLDLEDHFTSHSFNNLYWTGFERYLDSLDPSPECAFIPATQYAAPDSPDAQTAAERVEDLADQQPHDESVHDGVDEYDEQLDSMNAVDEVGVTTSRTGELVPLANQLYDYVYRAPELDRLTLWDFVSRTKKEGKS
ncbi:hypothetical protein CERSUDRAFT_21875, partial [Gelatoporia subvermispora B]